MSTRAVAVGLAVVLSACGGENDDGSGAACPPNLICHLPSDASVDAASDAPSDAPADAFVCTDLTLEPNDTIPQAFATPVASVTNHITLAGLTICPAGDKDFYQVQITQSGQSLEVVIGTNGAPVEGAIVDSTGTTIATTAPVPSLVGYQRAYAPNLAQGNYYVEAFAAPGDVSEYKFTLTVRGI